MWFSTYGAVIRGRLTFNTEDEDGKFLRKLGKNINHKA